MDFGLCHVIADVARVALGVQPCGQPPHPAWLSPCRRAAAWISARPGSGSCLVVAHCRAVLEPVEALLLLLDPDAVPDVSFLI